MNEFLTWAILGTFAGATGITVLIVQFIKPLSWLQKIDTRIIAYLTALVILVAATLVTGGTVTDIILAILNAFIVAAAAMGTYEVTFKPIDEAKKQNN